MTTPNFGEQIKVLTHLEKCLSSAEWGELSDPLNESAKILRALLHLTTLFSTSEAYDNGLRQNVYRIFENNIRVISVISQFHANGLSEDVMNRVCKMAEFLPKPETATNLPSCAEVSELKLDSKVGQKLSCHLRNITDVMNYIQEILQLFKLAFFACNEDVFYSQDFASVSLELKEVVTMLEFKSVSTFKQMGGNSFLVMFFKTLDGPLKIAMSALWLLFTFPTVTNVKFDVILELCQSAVQVFVWAVNILKNLTQFLLKDFDMLKVLGDQLLKKFQLVSEYCTEILKLKPREASVLKKLGDGESVHVLKDAICESVDVSEETQNNSILKSTVNLNGTHCYGFCVANELQENSAVKPGDHLENTLHFCNQSLNNAGTLKETQKTFAIQFTAKVTDINGPSVDVPKETLKTSALKPAMNAATSPLNFCDPKLNTADVLEETQKTFALKSSVIVKDTKYASVTASNESSRSSVLKAVVNVENMDCNDVSILKESQRTSVLKSTENVIHPVLSQNVYDSKFNTMDTSKETKKTSTLKSPVSIKNTNSISVEILKKNQNTVALKSILNENDPPVSANFCNTNSSMADCSKRTQKTSALKSTLGVNNAANSCATNTSCASSPFLDLWDFKTDMLTLEQRKTVNEVIKSYKYHVNNLSFSVRIAESEVGILCKICNQILVAKNIEKHLKNECQPQNLLKKSNDNRSTRTRVPINQASSAPKIAESEVQILCKSSDQTLVAKSIKKHLEKECQPQNLLKESNDNQSAHVAFPISQASRAPKIVESEVRIPCKICDQTLVTKNIEKHLKNECQPQNLLKKIINNQSAHAAVPISQASSAPKLAESKVQIPCKIRDQTLAAKNIEKYLKTEYEPPNLLKRSNDNQSAHAAVPMNQASGAPTIQLGSGIWYLDINDIESDSLALKQRKILQELIEKLTLYTNNFSFGVRIVKSELQAVGCKFCEVAFLPENIEEHIKDLNHQRNVFKNCKKSLEIRAAVSQISAENWKFLQLAPGGQVMCLCCLCGHKIALSVNAWIQHFYSSLHCEKLKKFQSVAKPGKKDIFKDF